MSSKIETLATVVQAALGDTCVRAVNALGELTVVVKSVDLLAVAQRLRDAPELKFEQLIDLCGVDYSAYGNGAWDGQRYAVVYHLLSLSCNARLRLRVFAGDDDFPGAGGCAGRRF